MLRALIHTLAFALAALAPTLSPAMAQDLAQPEGPVVLTVSGALEVTNVGDSAQFDLAMLEALGESSFTTSTIWTKGRSRFSGVSLATLVQRLGITGTTLRARAINDYAIDIPLSDAVENGPIISYRMDDKTMSVRDKGPLWIVYPYDQSPAYRSEVIYSRSIWQLDRIEVVN